MNKALIIVDFQEDFLPNGALGVTGGHQASYPLWKLMDEVDIIVFTRDWHPADHVSFAEGTPEYKDGSWPPHCVQGTPGAQIDDETWDRALDTGKPVLLVNKGYERDKEAYSGFDGRVVGVMNRPDLIDKLEGATLHQAFASLSVRKVKVGGLALDYCVPATALDSVKRYETTVVVDATRPVDLLDGIAATVLMSQRGINLDTRKFLQ